MSYGVVSQTQLFQETIRFHVVYSRADAQFLLLASQQVPGGGNWKWITVQVIPSTGGGVYMKVRVYATLKDIVGARAVCLQHSKGDTVGAVLDRLTGEFPKLEDKLFDSDDQLKQSVNVMVNGRNVRWLEGLETVLDKDDRLSIFPAVAGGS
jgi:molybdopterin synthase sulfur carrier subunit